MINDDPESYFAREDVFEHRGGLKLCEVETGITYWLAMREGTPEEARAIIEREYGPGCEPDDEEFIVTEVSRERAMKLKVHDEENPTTDNMWLDFYHRTEPCVLACSEY